MAAADVETAQRAMSTYASVMATNARINEMNKNMVSLKLRYKSKHPTMIDAQALLADIKKRFRNEISAIMQNPSELDFWSEYKLRMKPLEKAMDPPAASPTQQKTAEQAEEKWLAMVQGALSARTGALKGQIGNRQKHHDRVVSRITDIEVAEKNDQFELKIAEKAFEPAMKIHDTTQKYGKGKVSTCKKSFYDIYNTFYSNNNAWKKFFDNLGFMVTPPSSTDSSNNYYYDYNIGEENNPYLYVPDTGKY